MATATGEIKRTTTDGKAGGQSPLSAEELRKMDAYWRAANYLSVDRSTSWTTRC
jgi:phosphoketolase